MKRTAEVMRSLGGECFPVECDHTQDQQTEEVFKRVREERWHGSILQPVALMPGVTRIVPTPNQAARTRKNSASAWRITCERVTVW